MMSAVFANNNNNEIKDIVLNENFNKQLLSIKSEAESLKLISNGINDKLFKFLFKDKDRELFNSIIEEFLNKLINYAKNKMQNIEGQQPLCNDAIKSFKGSMQNSYIEGSLSREIFKDNMKELATGKITSRCGICQLYPRSFLIPNAYSTVMNFGPEEGRAIAKAQDSRIVRKMIDMASEVSTFEDIINYIKEKAEEVLIITSSVFAYRKFNGYSISYSRANKTPKHIGTLTIDNTPVNMFYCSVLKSNQILVINKETIDTLEQCKYKDEHLNISYSGLFKYIKNDAELAMVVGHEMAHALCCHISERQETELFKNILGTAVELTLEDKRYHKGYKTASHLGVTLPYSRKQEYEADYLGLRIATEAGYFPKAALKFLEKLGKIPKSEQEFEFFSTHPSASNRKKKLEQRFYEFQSIYDKLGKAQTPPVNTSLKTYSQKRKRNKNESIMSRYVRERFLKDLNK